jgi:signal transduction histidine kinase
LTALLAALIAVHALLLRRRLVRVADAEHELRGALTAFCLAARRVPQVESEVARAVAALGDLTAARRGRRATTGPAAHVPLEGLVRAAARAWATPEVPIEVDWRCGSGAARVAPGRVAQVLGNLLSNAVEHGAGPVRIGVRRTGEALRLEVSNATRRVDRGRGLRIAAQAARDCGGALAVAAQPERVTATLELPFNL